jgi:hypothetical protein
LSRKFDNWSPSSFKLTTDEIERAIAQVRKRDLGASFDRHRLGEPFHRMLRRANVGRNAPNEPAIASSEQITFRSRRFTVKNGV